MTARLYRVKDNYTGLKYCSTRQPAPEDYIYSCTLQADSPDKVYSSLKTLSRNKSNPSSRPLKMGDIIVISGCAYMSVKIGWVAVPFNEKEALV